MMYIVEKWTVILFVVYCSTVKKKKKNLHKDMSVTKYLFMVHIYVR